jgi:hypothetical protein
MSKIIRLGLSDQPTYPDNAHISRFAMGWIVAIAASVAWSQAPGFNIIWWTSATIFSLAMEKAFGQGGIGIFLWFPVSAILIRAAMWYMEYYYMPRHGIRPY